MDSVVTLSDYPHTPGIGPGLRRRAHDPEVTHIITIDGIFIARAVLAKDEPPLLEGNVAGTEAQRPPVPHEVPDAPGCQDPALLPQPLRVPVDQRSERPVRVRDEPRMRCRNRVFPDLYC